MLFGSKKMFLAAKSYVTFLIPDHEHSSDELGRVHHFSRAGHINTRYCRNTRPGCKPSVHLDMPLWHIAQHHEWRHAHRVRTSPTSMPTKSRLSIGTRGPRLWAKPARYGAGGRTQARFCGGAVRHAQEEYLLDVADRLGVDIPCVCRSGTCASCAVQLLQGTVEYEDLFITVPSLETLLSEQEIADSLVPSCRSRATSDAVLAFSESGLH